MREKPLKHFGEGLLANLCFRRKRKRITAVLAVFVVIGTIGSLVLPAITLSHDRCGLEEHTHGSACYDANNSLVFPLNEAGENHHVDGCNETSKPLVEEGHKHEDDCYLFIKSETLTCNRKESSGHIHEADCYTQNKTLTCTTEESAEHSHSIACYANEETLRCTIEENSGHRHNDDCFVWLRGERICTEEEREPVVEAAEPTLICEIPEHTHGESCREEKADANVLETVTEDLTASVAEAEATGTTDTMNLPQNNDATSTTTPIQLDEAGKGYVKEAKLYYLPKGAEDIGVNWVEITAATTNIPGDATVKLRVFFHDVPTDALLEAGGQITYTLPPELRNPVVSGDFLDADNNKVGTITADGTSDSVLLTFDEAWLKAQQAIGKRTIEGDFYLTSQFDLTEIDHSKPGKIVIGGIEIDVNFEGDMVAKYGNVDITKVRSNSETNENIEVIETDDGDFLKYTLTVTAGEDGCPDVLVADKIEAGTANIEGYVLEGTYAPVMDVGTVYLGSAMPSEAVPVPPAKTDADPAPGYLIWNIGQMQPNETQTLTYYVKLKGKTEDDPNSYIGGHPLSDIQNAASVYSGQYPKDESLNTFHPVADGYAWKEVAMEPEPTANGDYILHYQIKIRANEENNYTLDNVKIKDGFNWKDSYNRNQYVDLISFDPNSFKLYPADGTHGSPVEIGADKIRFTDDTTSNTRRKYFELYVSDMAPGQYYTLTYDVVVNPELFVQLGNQAITIRNRIEMHPDEGRTDNLGMYEGLNKDFSGLMHRWSRKILGETVKNEATIAMNDQSENFYDATGGGVQSMTAPEPKSFTVPANSIKYNVVVNENGDWDMSSAVMQDSLGEHLRFAGYVWVRAYEIPDNMNFPAGADAANNQKVLNTLTGIGAAKSAWVKVEDLATFSFKPDEIGMGAVEGAEAGKTTYAYVLEYYAKPDNVEGITNILVGNTFHLSGTVGIGNYSFVLSGIQIGANAVVQGSNSFHVTKSGWYYDPADTTWTGAADGAKGAIYWIIKLDGNQIPVGTQLKDLAAGNGASNHFIRENSLAGVYVAPTSLNVAANYDVLQEFLDAYPDAAVAPSVYQSAVDTTANSMTVTFPNGYTPGEGNALYIILRTEPQAPPDGPRSNKTYHNRIQTHSSDGTWIDRDTASQTIYGDGGIFKELGNVVEYDGSVDTIESTYSGVVSWSYQRGKSVIATLFNKEPGTYVSWQVQANYEGKLSGDYVVTELIPQGMEIAYIREFWKGGQAADVTTGTIENPGEGWTAVTLSGNNMTYYVHDSGTGQQVKWQINNLHPGNPDAANIEYQVVCRVTDPDVLQGGVSGVFNNQVTLTNHKGSEIGRDENAVTITRQTLSKSGTYNPDTNSGIYPFELELNKLGEDLSPGGDTVTLVDEMSATLELVVSSIVVTDTRTNTALTGDRYTASLEARADGGKTLKIVLPDNMPLKVNYNCKINAVPGSTINISNNAHWEGYTQPTGGKVEVEDFHFTAGGSVGGVDHPTIKLRKSDQYNLNAALAGATFRITKVTMGTDGNWIEDTSQNYPDATTGVDGTLEFGTDVQHLLDYNTVYRLTEITAPGGYIRNTEPVYVAVAKLQEDGTYPTFPEGVTVKYGGTFIELDVLNEKGKAQVEKKFLDAGGKELSKIDGTYKFGIYKVEGETETLHQTVTITIANGAAVTTAYFTNLDHGITYRIYELDDSGQKISHDTVGTVSGKCFIVTYPSKDGLADQDVLITIENGVQTIPSVAVTNQVFYTELPATGGVGADRFYGAGLLLITLSLCLWGVLRRTNKQEREAK